MQVIFSTIRMIYDLLNNDVLRILSLEIIFLDNG